MASQLTSLLDDGLDEELERPSYFLLADIIDACQLDEPAVIPLEYFRGNTRMDLLGKIGLAGHDDGRYLQVLVTSCARKVSTRMQKEGVRTHVRGLQRLRRFLRQKHRNIYRCRPAEIEKVQWEQRSRRGIRRPRRHRAGILDRDRCPLCGQFVVYLRKVRDEYGTLPSLAYIVRFARPRGVVMREHMTMDPRD